MSQNTTQECIIGTIENVVFRNEKNDYTVIDDRWGRSVCIRLV